MNATKMTEKEGECNKFGKCSIRGSSAYLETSAAKLSYGIPQIPSSGTDPLTDQGP